jgi:hypothetical protein
LHEVPHAVARKVALVKGERELWQPLRHAHLGRVKGGTKVPKGRTTRKRTVRQDAGAKSNEEEEEEEEVQLRQ